MQIKFRNRLAKGNDLLDAVEMIDDVPQGLGVFGDVGNTWPGLAMVDLADLYKGVGS